MVHSKVNIICLYWVGQFRGRDFTMKDVVRLYQSVSKHIDRQFTFYCLTNSTEEFPDYVVPIELKYNWPGWWSKVELHRPDLPDGRTLYMDLDSHAIKSLQPILDYEGDLVMFPTGIPERKKARLEMQGWGVRYQAATMLFYPGTDCMKKVWDTFLKNPDGWMKKYRSDQDVMGKWIPDQPMFPREWMCKLDSIRKNPKWWEEPPEDVIIVTGQTPDGFFRATDTIPWFEQTAR